MGRDVSYLRYRLLQLLTDYSIENPISRYAIKVELRLSNYDQVNNLLTPLIKKGYISGKLKQTSGSSTSTEHYYLDVAGIEFINNAFEYLTEFFETQN